MIKFKEYRHKTNPANLRGFYTLANTALPNHPPLTLAQIPHHTQYQIQARGIESKPTYPRLTPLLSQCRFLFYPLSHRPQFAPSYLRIFAPF